MEPQVAFYRLSRKVVNNQDAIPEEARQVMYYSLAIGHHVGVMDCLSELMVVPVTTFTQSLELLEDGAARRKLEGVLQWNEIEINRSHVDALLPPLKTLAARPDAPTPDWVHPLIQSLQEMVAEPAFYLMVKLRE